MNYKEIKTKTLLKKNKKIDSWFLSRYSMNLYRGCEHDCIYCDGRSEKYYVDGIFNKDISIKINAVELLEKELNTKKKPLKKGFILIGGGVGDSYQQAEKDFEITRNILKLLNNYDFPIHILSKSTLLKRDIDILKNINHKNPVIISFSLSSSDDRISKIFEPNTSSSSERLRLIEHLKKEGFSCGVYYMPIIPFVTDSSNMIDSTLKDIKKSGADFVIFGGMTLKNGIQKEYFMNTLKDFDKSLIDKYKNIYDDNDKWGNANFKYYEMINNLFRNHIKKYGIAKRIPFYIYNDILDENDKIIVILEHLDYLARLNGSNSSYGFAANTISKIDEPISKYKDMLKSFNGIGNVTERIILEILSTGRCKYYEKLLYN